MQALDLHAHQLISQRLQDVHDPNDYTLKKLHTEMRQKLSDVRGRGSVLYREWFFHNPISHLRECDGDRCEFWRFRYPGRWVANRSLCSQLPSWLLQSPGGSALDRSAFHLHLRLICIWIRSGSQSHSDLHLPDYPT